MTVINFQQAMEQASKASFDPLPDGTYDLICIETTPTESATNKPMIKAKYQVETGPSVGKKVFTQYTFSPESDTALAIFFRQMAFHGLDAAFFAAQPAWETVAASLVGRRVRMQLDQREWQGQMRNNVKQVMPPSDGGAVVAQVPPAAPPPQVAPPQVAAPATVAPMAVAPQVPAPAVPVAAPPVAPVAAPVAPVAAPEVPAAPVAAPVTAPVAAPVPTAEVPQAAPVAAPVAAPIPPVAAPVAAPVALAAAPVVPVAEPVAPPVVGGFVQVSPPEVVAPVAPVTAPVVPVAEDPSATASEDI